VFDGVQGGVLWFYLAAVVAYLGVPWCVAFILGLLWKKLSEPVSSFTYRTINLLTHQAIAITFYFFNDNIISLFVKYLLLIRKTR